LVEGEKVLEWQEKINSCKMLSVMDHNGHYIFVHVCLGNNDRVVFTSSPLYSHEGDFFSDDEWVSSNGGCEGSESLCVHTRTQEIIP
jgi:hypothetical protein